MIARMEQIDMEDRLVRMCDIASKMAFYTGTVESIHFACSFLKVGPTNADR